MPSTFCTSYCEHGGRCELPAGHAEALHDSGYCQWDDAHAIPKAEADALLSREPGGDEQLMIEGVFRGFLGDYEEDEKEDW